MNKSNLYNHNYNNYYLIDTSPYAYYFFTNNDKEKNINYNDDSKKNINLELNKHIDKQEESKVQYNMLKSK